MELIRSRISSSNETLIKVGFTGILLGYFLVWLPHRAVGLSLIGLEMGEWTKFLPGVQQDLYTAERLFFYLPPITLSMMLITWIVGWPKSWRTWAIRGIAVLISMLSLPSIESIQSEPTGMWLPRMLLVAMVIVTAGLAPIASRLNRRGEVMLKGSVFAAMGLLGALLPMWVFVAYRPEIQSIYNSQIGIGPGLLLNTVSHILLMITGVSVLIGASKPTDNPSNIS